MPLRVPSSMIATIGFRQRAWTRSASPSRKIIVMSGEPPTKLSAASAGAPPQRQRRSSTSAVGLGERPGDRRLDVAFMSRSV